MKDQIKKFGPIGALVAAALGGGYILAPGTINDDELVALDALYARVELGVNNAQAAYQLEDEQLGEILEWTDGAVADFRQTFSLAYLLEPDPNPPPIDPPPPDPEYGVPPDVVLADWEWKPVSGAGRPASVPPFESGNVMEAFDFHGSEPGAYTQNGITNGSKSLKSGLIVRNALIRDWKKWGCRGYGIQSDVHFVNCTIRDGSAEHGFYSNISGMGPGAVFPSNLEAVSFRWCLWENIPSQAVQIVQAGRANEYLDPAFEISPGGWIVLEDCMLRNISDPAAGARPSFSLSFFETMNSVRLTRVTLDNGMQGDSRGGFMAHAREELIVEDCRFVVGVLQQPMGQIWDVEHVRITNTIFAAQGGQDWLDIKGADTIEISGCTGPTQIRVDGVGVGTVEMGYAQ